MTTTTRPTATAALAEFVGRPHGRVPDAALTLARSAVVDVVGCALAAAREPTVTISAGVVSGDGPSTVIVDGGRAAPDRAALLNGTAAHALDYDDVDDLLIGHPSTVLVPAVLAVAESVDASGAQAVEGYWRGLTVMRALAAGLRIGDHYSRGWHPTATSGTVGAAAAAATVLGLDAAQAHHALGIAVSRSAGCRENFGSMTKPLHAGVSAADGVLAAQLARMGFTAGRDPFDGPFGYLSLYSGGETLDPDERAAAAGRVVAVLDDPPLTGLNVKLFPCCYAAAAAGDAARDLVLSGVRAEDVTAVHVAVPPRGLVPLITAEAATGLEGKFSMAYVVASALADGDLGFESFTDEAVIRPHVRALARLVTADESMDLPASDGLVFAAEVTVRTRTGETRTVRCRAPRGHADRPVTEDQLLAKFADCVAFGGGGGPERGRSVSTGLVSTGLVERLLELPESPDVSRLIGDR